MIYILKIVGMTAFAVLAVISIFQTRRHIQELAESEFIPGSKSIPGPKPKVSDIPRAPLSGSEFIPGSETEDSTIQKGGKST
jgi:hypothetical protein